MSSSSMAVLCCPSALVLCPESDCENGGTCYLQGKVRTCLCAPGFEGDRCEKGMFGEASKYQEWQHQQMSSIEIKTCCLPWVRLIKLLVSFLLPGRKAHYCLLSQ